MEKVAENIKILLAEDDANLGFVIQDNLKSNGYKVTLCSDGDTALKTFANEKFDLCILDVMMPKKDGFAVAQTIRDVNKYIPIVFLTAKSMQEDKVRGFTLGADDYRFYEELNC
jgi:DNA-binding response OmpR family regulator